MDSLGGLAGCIRCGDRLALSPVQKYKPVTRIVRASEMDHCVIESEPLDAGASAFCCIRHGLLGMLIVWETSDV